MSQQPGILPPSMALVVRAEDGDTFASISAQFACPEDKLRETNPHVYDITPGTELVVPLQIAQCMAEDGDTAETIAAQFDTTVEALSAVNPGVTTIGPGTVLNIP